MNPPKYIKYVLSECNSFLKSPGKIKGCLVMIYIKVHISECEEIKKYSMLKWRLFFIQKLMIICMIELYVHNLFSLYNVFLETDHINNQTILHFVHLCSK